MTITTLRPNGDGLKSGDLVYSSGTAAFSLLNDDVDTSYVRAPTGKQYPAEYLHLNMTNPSITATQRIKQARIRARVRMHASDPGHSANIAARMWDPQSGLGYPPAGWQEEPADPMDVFATSNASTFQAKTGVWHLHPPPSDLDEWTVAILTRIALHVAWGYSVGSLHENLRVSELYIDVDIRDQPVVSGVTASGYTTSTRPTASWTYVPNADADPQVAWQVKVFSAAQYGASNFSADTSPAAYDSGQRSGSGTSFTLDKDLGNGITYKVYVRAAQDFNGNRWFSAWSSSSAFTVNPTAPAVPLLTVTQDPSVPNLRNIIKVQGMMNMLSYQNSTLEDINGANIGTWVAGTNATITTSSTVAAAHGTFSLRLSSAAAGNMFASTPTGLNGQLVAGGQQYTALASFRTGVSARTCKVNIIWYDRSGAVISTSSGGGITDGTGGWTQASVTATAPANARYAAVQVEVDATAAANELHYVDKVDLHPGSSTTWTLGGGLQSGGSTVVEVSWGTMGQGNLAPPQLWGGGDVDDDTTGFAVTGASSTVTFDLSDRYWGDGSIRWDVWDATSTLYIGAPTASTTDTPAPDTALHVVPGQIYSASIRAKASTNFTSTLSIQALDKDWNTVGSAGTASVTILSSGWNEYKVENWTAPAGAVYARLTLSNGGSVTDRRVWVDYVKLVRATVVATQACFDTNDQPSGQPVDWTAVHGADVGDLVMTSGDTSAYVFDEAVPPGYTLTYRAWNVVTDQLGGGLVSSDSSPYVQTLMPAPGRGLSVLKNPNDALNRLQVDIIDAPISQHEELTVYYPVRPAVAQGFFSRPVVVSDYVGGHDGTLTIVAANDDDWWRLQQLVGAASTLFLANGDFGGKFIRIAGDRTIGNRYSISRGEWVRTVSFSYVHADRPG